MNDDEDGDNNEDVDDNLLPLIPLLAVEIANNNEMMNFSDNED